MYEQIPSELRRRDQWICWKLEDKRKPNGNIDKVKIPYIPLKEGIKASVSNNKTWREFKKAIESVNKGLHDGIGFVFAQHDGYAGIDLDHCITEGKITDWALDIIKRFDGCYIEYSQSGTGIHIIFKGKLPENVKHEVTPPGASENQKIEIYDNKRFFVVTGNVYNENGNIQERQTELDSFLKDYDLLKTEQKEPFISKSSSITTLTQPEIIDIIRHSKQADKFSKLYDQGGISEYNNDDSRADEALCCIIAFYTKNVDVIDSIMRSSKLYRDKWDRADYRDRTIKYALEHTIESYTPGQLNKQIGTMADDNKKGTEELPKLAEGKNLKLSEFDKHKAEIQAILGKHSEQKTALKEAESYIKSITNPNITGKLWQFVNSELKLTEHQTKSELAIHSAKELAKEDIPEPSWVVNGYIPEGLTILAGKPKMGKSWLALGLAVAIASGGRAFGTIDVFESQGAVLYLALEDNKRRLKARLAKLCQGSEFPENLYYATAFDKGDLGVNCIKAWLDKHKEDARLIIVDTFASFRARAKGKVINEYDRDNSDLEPLQTLAGDLGIGIIVIHHLRKAPSDDDFDTISGTLGMTSKPDSILILKKGNREGSGVLKARGRDYEQGDIEVALKFDPITAIWTLLGDADTFLVSEERQELIDLFKKSNEPLSPKQIGDMLGKNINTVKGLIGKMVMNGTLIQVGYGKYFLSVNAINSINAVNSINS